jgi:hypothetical protein
MKRSGMKRKGGYTLVPAIGFLIKSYSLHLVLRGECLRIPRSPLEIGQVEGIHFRAEQLNAKYAKIRRLG